MKDESNSDAVTLDPPTIKMEQPAEAPSLMDSTPTPVRPDTLQIVSGTPAFSDFVVVREKDDPSCEPIELPVSAEDNTLALQTLKTICSLATGLKYKNPASGAYRALLMDPTGAKFVPPTGGWDGKVFIVVAQQAQAPAQKPALPTGGGLKKSSGGTDQNAKRRKLAVESDEDGSGGSTNNHAAAASKQKRLNPSNDDEADKDGEGPLPPKQRSIEDNENDGKNGENAADPENDNGDEGETGVETDSMVDAVHESKSPSGMSGGNDNRFSDLIVLGIPFKMTESELRSYFEQFGKVALAEIKKKTTGGSKGFGFVRMETTEGQIRVLNKPIHTIGGRKCQVKVPLAKPGREPRENPLTQSKLFIGKLQEKTTNATLKHFFEAEARKLDPKCEILDLYIPRPFRGFAFATFTSPDVVKQLIRRGEFVVDGAPVTVSSATPKQMGDDRSARASPPMMHHGGGGRSQGGYGRGGGGGYGGPNYGPPPPLAQQQRGAPMPYGGGPYGGSGGPPSWPGGSGGPPPLSYGSGIGTHHAWGGFGGGGAGHDGGPQRYGPLPSSHPPPFSQFGGGSGQTRPDPLFAVGGKPPSNAPPTTGGFPPGTGGAGNPMALGLETLNLNNMKPEVMTEAWKAFVRVAAEASGGAGGNIGDGRPSTGGYGSGGGVGGGAPSPFSNESTLKSYGQQMASMHQQPPQSHHRPGAGGGGGRGGPSNTSGSGGAGGGASSMNWR